MKFVYAFWCAVALSCCSCECLRMLQAVSYKPQRGYAKLLLTPYFAILGVVAVFSWAWGRFFPIQPLLCSVYSFVGLMLLFLPRKCPLVWTKRVCRIAAVETLLLFGCCCVALHWWVVTLPAVVLIAFALCLPIDWAIAKKYIKAAQQKLQKSGVKVVAVTGSYGKTSVKEMLCTLLAHSVAPSGSCNTPLGIAKFINTTNLSCHKFLILEFGARQKGDIATLCKLFSPDYGIVTGVCQQHLSTFGTFQNVVAAKRELVENLPSCGVCLLCDQSVHKFAETARCATLSRPQICISQLQVSLRGLQFLADGEKVMLPMIAPHAAMQFAFCATMCKLLGQQWQETLSRIQNIRQVPHRMQVSHNGRFFIVDDSYNANIVGVQACCDVLRRVEGQKVSISQGIVEGGKKQKQLNFQCGNLLGSVCKTVVVFGKNRKSLKQGAAEHCKVLEAKNLKHAVELVAPLLAQDDVLLFQNDLPDVPTI